jgi:hypothetical protein
MHKAAGLARIFEEPRTHIEAELLANLLASHSE